MRTRKKAILGTLASFATLAVVTIAGLPSAPVQAAEGRAQVDPMVFARGAQLWAETCGRCHNVRSAQELRDDEWRASVMHMRVRSGITQSEAEAILIFLQESN